MQYVQYDPCWTLEMGPLKNILEKNVTALTPIYIYPQTIPFNENICSLGFCVNIPSFVL